LRFPGSDYAMIDMPFNEPGDQFHVIASDCRIRAMRTLSACRARFVLQLSSACAERRR
jgi:hypothetical protein